MECPGNLLRAAGISPYQRCLKASLADLFQSPYVDESVDSCYTDVFSPSVALVPTSTEAFFDIPPSENFTDLSRMVLTVRLKLVTETGEDLPDFTATESVGIVDEAFHASASTDPNAFTLSLFYFLLGLDQYPLSTLFSNIEHRLCSVPLLASDNTQPFSSYFVQLLSFGFDSRSSRQQVLVCQFFSFIYSFIHSFIHSYLYSFIHSSRGLEMSKIWGI